MGNRDLPMATRNFNTGILCRLQRNGESHAGSLTSVRAVGAITFVLLCLGLQVTSAWASDHLDAPLVSLKGHTTVSYDEFNVPTIFAKTEHDAILMQGYLHARDRFFQMDVQRRTYSGALAELLGPEKLQQDIQYRTLGVRRSAQWSKDIQSKEVLDWLDAYAKGVNAWLDDDSQPLPPEYKQLELTGGSVPRWTPIDSLTIMKGRNFLQSFSYGDLDNTLRVLKFVEAGKAQGFDGVQLYFDDIYRSAPFDPTVSIPGAQPLTAPAASLPDTVSDYYTNLIDRETAEQVVGNWRKLEPFPCVYDGPCPDGGNWLVVSGDRTKNGLPILANDPHMALGAPAEFYQNHLNVAGSLNVSGVSFPGVPGVVLGCNDNICWGGTVNPVDVTDIYQETLISDPVSGLPVGTLFDGNPEALFTAEQDFAVNNPGDGIPDNLTDAGIGPLEGGLTFLSQRRDYNPVVGVSELNQDHAFTIQFTGFRATRELQSIRLMNYADDLDDFKEALQFWDTGSLNFSYADVDGNIAYFTSGELPIREDLQTLGVPGGGIPPFFIRDGTHTLPHEWLPPINVQPGQALNNEILPFAEMPQVVNPAGGFIINANNDPIGTTLDNNPYNQQRAGGGLLYFSPSYANGFRAGRIQRLLEQLLAGGNKLDVADIATIQSNSQLLDAEFVAPFLTDAFANASAEGADPALATFAGDPAIAEAVKRLGDWDFSTPTGIREGFDPFDSGLLGPLPDPTIEEIETSIGATIYSVFRGRAVDWFIDEPLSRNGLFSNFPGDRDGMAALRNVLDTPGSNGIGASGVNFFFVPGIADPETSRDIKLLTGLRQALDLLASDDFAPAFGNSTNQDDYRWGKLHRIVFDHPLGNNANVPPAVGLPNLSPGLPGISRAGGLGAVDASSHIVRARSLDDFMFYAGPARRTLAVLDPASPLVLDVIPGGQNGVIAVPPGLQKLTPPVAGVSKPDAYSGHHDQVTAAPFRTDQLRLWLVNDYHSLPVDIAETDARTVHEDVFKFSAAPNNTTASDGTYQFRVEVKWQKVRGADSYRVYRCLDRGNTCGNPIGIRSGTSLNDGKGNPGQVYFYRVRACMGDTCSKFSVADSGFRQVDDIPKGVTATDGMFVDRVRVTWNSVPGATHYRVYRCLDRGNTCGKQVGNPTGRIFVDRRGKALQVYYYRVRSCKGEVCSKFSAADSGHRGEADIPTAVEATDGTFDDRVRITWNDVPGATSYRVFRCLDRGNSCGLPIGSPTGTSFADRRGNEGQVYYYRVRSCKDGVCSKFSLADAGHRGVVGG